MINSYIHAALARERQKTFLAEAEAYRRAKQARSHRQRVGTLVAPRSPLRWIPSWLRPDWSRCATSPTWTTTTMRRSAR
jgi:hypothetical protein